MAPSSPPQDNYLTHTRGVASWLFTLDHKRIGVMYLVSIVGGLLLGGVFAMLIRIELMDPGKTIMDRKLYNQVFTLHGAIMIFLFVIPGIPAALGNFVLPIMLGARDVAFPRLNLFSLYLWWAGALFFVANLVLGAVDTGWTFYAPYSSTYSNTNVPTALAGAFILGFSSIFNGVNFIATMHTMRPPGMTWFRMPLFLWGLYSTAILQLLATPVLGVTLILLGMERVLHIGIFDPKLGGDPVLFQHFFWFYSHPAVYIMIVPAFGVISELVATFSHKHIFGYKAIAMSSVAIAFLSFLVWGHHMFVSSQTILSSVLFSAMTFSVAIPSAIKVFNWLATMYRGSIWLATPMCYALMFIFLFGIGGLTGLFLGTLAVDVHVTDTYFVVAHFHYVMFGGTVVAFLGGLHYWWPKMTGRMYSEFWGLLTVLIMFVGFNLTFFPQFVLGSRGMPRRYYDYTALMQASNVKDAVGSVEAHPEFWTLHYLSSIGAFILGFSFVIMLIYLIASLVNGRRAPANPWGGATLEWQTSSPPPVENFADPPMVGDPYDMSGIEYDPKVHGFVRT